VRLAAVSVLGLAIVIGASACHDSTAPAAPLPVEFRRGFATLATSASIDAFGRDVLGVMVRPLPCNYQSGGSATLADGRLDVVITLIDLGPVPCAVLPGSSVDSVVVHGVPAGTFDAALHLRVVSGATAVDSIIARQTVTKGS
jgi:hypothetical protein